MSSKQMPMLKHKRFIGYYLFLPLLLLGPAKLRAQEPCGQSLAEAEEKYRRQRHEEAIALINACLGKGNATREQQELAYELLSRVYLAKDAPDSAKASLRKLRKLNSGWRPDSTRHTRAFRSFAEGVIKEFERETLRKNPSHAENPSIARADSITRSDSSRTIPGQQGTSKAKESLDPRRLFTIPEAYALSSLVINIGGGTYNDNDRQTLLARTRIGFGGVAELEISNLGIINGLSEGKPAIPTAALKLCPLKEGLVFPAMAFELRTSLWDSEERADSTGKMIKFEKQLYLLHLIASKKVRGISWHAGLSLYDLRLRSRNAANALISPTPEEIKANHNHEYINRTLIRPFLGAEIEMNASARLMMELEFIPEYRFDPQTPSLKPENAYMRVLSVGGVRYFPWRWFAIDVGVRSRWDNDGPGGDVSIETGVNLGFSLKRLFKIGSTE